MFEKIIESTKFAGDLANQMFSHISGDAINRDVSFISTIRALMWQRVPRTDSVAVRNYSFNSINSIELRTETGLLNNCLYLVNVEEDLLSDNKAELEKQFNDFAIPEHFSECEDVRQFFQPIMNCRVFVNESTRTSIAMVFNMNQKRMHLLQCVIPKLFPWYFATGSLTTNEKALLLSLKEKRPQAYEEALNILADTQEYNTLAVTSQLILIRRKINERRKNGLENTIADLNGQIADLMDRIQLKYDSLRRNHLTLCGVLNDINTNDGGSDRELTDFIAANPNIKIADMNNNVISFGIKGYIDIYDADAYKSLSSNNNSFYWNSGYLAPRNFEDTFASKEARKLLLDSVFSDDPKFKLRTCAVFDFNMESMRVSPNPSAMISDMEYSNYYPNPHLYHNRCMGSYGAVIHARVNEGDMTGALSQCIMSTHTVNVAENASFRWLVAEIFTPNKRYFEDSEGNTYTAQEAYEKLISEANPTDDMPDTNEGDDNNATA